MNAHSASIPLSINTITGARHAPMAIKPLPMRRAADRKSA